MKFSCEKYLLQSAINTASRAAAAKSPIPALEGLLIEAGSQVKITGYDLKKGVYTSFPADVAQPGRVVLGAKIFGEIVRSMPDGIVSVEMDKDMLTTIRCGSAEFSIMGSSDEDYPELPDVQEQSKLTMEQGTLREMIGQTLFAVSDNESRPVYTGALFQVQENTLTLVAVDGYRLALRKEEILSNELTSPSFIVPGTALSDVEKLCTDPEEPVSITVGSKHICFSMGKTVLISRRLEGEFMDYRKSIATDFSILLTAERTELSRTIERVSLIIDDKLKNPLHCFIRKDKIDFVCTTALGRAEDSCPAEGDGGDLEIGFNNRYLLDALKNAPADKVLLCMNTGSTPCVIKPADEEEQEKFLYMILPVRLRA